MQTISNAASLQELDMRSILHPASSISEVLEKGPILFAEGIGCKVKTSTGKELIDAVGGLWCVNVGYGREELARAAFSAMKKMGYYHTYSRASNAAQIHLADRVLQLLREEAGVTQMNKVFFGCTGSDAIDSMVKLVWYYNNIRGFTKKKKIISRKQAYHGVTVASGSLTGLQSFHEWFDLPIKGILHAEPAYFYRHAIIGEDEIAFGVRLAKDLEDMILAEGPESVAAFVAEPIMGAGGVIPPPENYFSCVQAVLRKYDILFLVDEVICGYGRLGHWFGSGRYDLKPDLVAMAKGLTSGYFPMSAVAISEPIWDVLEEGSRRSGFFAHGFTYSGHPVGAEVALANLDIIEREKLVENARDVGDYLTKSVRARLQDHPNVGDIRAEGLIMGIEFVQDRLTKEQFNPTVGIHRRIAEQAFELGLIVRPLAANGILALSPPLTLRMDEADQVADILTGAVELTLASLERRQTPGSPPDFRSHVSSAPY